MVIRTIKYYLILLKNPKASSHEKLLFWSAMEGFLKNGSTVVAAPNTTKKNPKEFRTTMQTCNVLVTNV